MLITTNFEFGASRYLAITLIAMYLGAIIIASLSNPHRPFITMLVLLPICLGSCIFNLHHYAWLQNPNAITQIQLCNSDQWLLTYQQKISALAYLCGNSVITNQLLILNFRQITGERHTAIICSDTMPGDEFRKLKVLLLLHKPKY